MATLEILKDDAVKKRYSFIIALTEDVRDNEVINEMLKDILEEEIADDDLRPRVNREFAFCLGGRLDDVAFSDYCAKKWSLVNKLRVFDKLVKVFDDLTEKGLGTLDTVAGLKTVLDTFTPAELKTVKAEEDFYSKYTKLLIQEQRFAKQEQRFAKTVATMVEKRRSREDKGKDKDSKEAGIALAPAKLRLP